MLKLINTLLNAVAGAVIALMLISPVTGQDFTGLIPTDRLLGRDTAGTGQVEKLTVGGGLEFTGSVGIGIASDGVGEPKLDFIDGDTPADEDCITVETGGANGSLEAAPCAGGGSGDAISVEDGDNGGTFSAIDTTARFEDSADIDFVRTAGAPGGPDDISALVRGDAVAAIGTGKQPVALLAGAGVLPPAAAAIAPCTEVENFDSGSNDIFLKQCSFDAATDNAIYWTIPAPKSVDESVDLTARVDWTSATGTDGSDVVQWTFACVAFSNDDLINGNAFPTVDTVNDTQTAAGDFMSTAEITAITPAGTWAENDMLVCRLTRNADTGADTFNGTAELINVQLFFTTNANTDD